MKKLILLITLLTFTCICFGDEIDTRMRKEAQMCADALVDQDWGTIVKYTYPMIVEGIGGKMKMIQAIKQGSIQMKSDGVSVEKVIIGEPVERKKINNTIYALIPQELTMKVPGGLLHSDSHLIGISKDEGGSWYFLDTAKLNEQNLKILLPDLSGQMKIPPKKLPVFYER